MIYADTVPGPESAARIRIHALLELVDTGDDRPLPDTHTSNVKYTVTALDREPSAAAYAALLQRVPALLGPLRLVVDAFRDVGPTRRRTEEEPPASPQGFKDKLKAEAQRFSPGTNEASVVGGIPLIPVSSAGGAPGDRVDV